MPLLCPAEMVLPWHVENLDHAYFSALHSIVAHNMEFEGFDSILDQPI